MENPCKIIFFGDSITREYAPDFEKILKEKYPDKEITATNAGVIGETSRDGLKRVPNLLNESLDVVVIGFGMNDWRKDIPCLLYTSPSPRDLSTSRMPSSA